jgi:hypothetical protein
MRTDKELMELARTFWDPHLPEPTEVQIEEVLDQLTEPETERLGELLQERRRLRLRQSARFDQLMAELKQMLEF